MTESGHPVVSVVVPFHTTPPRFLREAVDSILEQEYADFEVLLVDDAGSDDARREARRAVDRDPRRVRLLRAGEAAPAGISAARNVALAAARGRLFAQLDSDDVWLPDKLSTHVAALDAEPRAAMIYGDSLYWFSWALADADAAPGVADDYVPPAGFDPGTLIEPPGLLRSFLCGRAAVPCPCSVIVRTGIARRAGGFEERFTGLYEDQVFFARMAAEHPVFYAGGVRERYRRHPDSICATADDAKEARARVVFLDWLDAWLEERGVTDGSLRRLVRRERAMAAHPVYGRVVRAARSALGRTPPVPGGR